jgi:hypothetical protein
MTKVIKMNSLEAKEIAFAAFDKAHENFKKIYTKDGINEEALIDFIGDTLKLVPNETRAMVTDHLVYNAINWGSYNYYEALGILKSVKSDYIKISEQVAAEEAEENK